jgi:ABC-type Mn2+/Zn2+ transport system ATPase subunit
MKNINCILLLQIRHNLTTTLDDVDTMLLLDDGLTAKGKPIEHHLMLWIIIRALRFILEQADK